MPAFMSRVGKNALIGILAGLIVVFLGILFVQGRRCDAVEEEIKNAKLARIQLEADCDKLSADLEFIKTDEGIELYARSQGMQMPGETLYER